MTVGTFFRKKTIGPSILPVQYWKGYKFLHHSACRTIREAMILVLFLSKKETMLHQTCEGSNTFGLFSVTISFPPWTRSFEFYRKWKIVTDEDIYSHRADHVLHFPSISWKSQLVASTSHLPLLSAILTSTYACPAEAKNARFVQTM